MKEATNRLFAVRGAIQLSEDTESEMEESVWRLISSLLSANAVSEERIVSILFTQTPDLKAANPASALRTRGFRYTPLLCSTEPSYAHSLPRIVRIMMHYYSTPTHTPSSRYLKGAVRLRPDLTVG